MKKLAMSVVGVAFAAIATGAFAVDEDLGVIPMTGDFEVVTFGNVVENPNGDAGTPFTDTFTFTIAAPVVAADISVVRLPLTLQGQELFLFEQFETILTNGGERIRFGDDNQSGDLTLEANTYMITITGRSIGSVGGNYIGAIAVQAVPIPAAGLLFFSGMAALGLVRSRRARA